LQKKKENTFLSASDVAGRKFLDQWFDSVFSFSVFFVPDIFGKKKKSFKFLSWKSFFGKMKVQMCSTVRVSKTFSNDERNEKC